MDTWNDFDESSDEDEKHASKALMADSNSNFDFKSIDEEMQILSDLSRNELIQKLNEFST